MATSSFCPQCGKPYIPDARFCSACGTAVTGNAAAFAAQPRLVRPRHPRMLAGVCSGIAIFYGWDVALVRILFLVALCLSLGLASFAYLAAWLLIPDAQYALPAVAQRQTGTV